MADTEKSGNERRLGLRFHAFWVGYTGSNLADGVLLTVIPLLATTLTRDPLLISGLTAVWYLPWLLFGLPAGALADRLARIRAMATANSLRGSIALVVCTLVLFDYTNIWLLYVAMFLLVSCETLYDSAGRAAVPQLVPPRMLMRANGRIEAGRCVAEDFLGAPAAGLLFATSAAIPLALNSGLYLVSSLVLLVVFASGRKDATRRQSTGTGEHALLFREVLDAFVFIRHVPAQRTLLITGIVVAAVAAIFNSVLVVFTLEALRVPPELYGAFLSSSAVGALAAAVAAEAIVTRLSRAAVLIGSHVFLGASLFFLAISTGFVTGAVSIAAVSFSITMLNIVAMTVLQSITPDKALGRVVSVRRTLTRGLSPGFALIGGLLARADLPLPMFVASGIALSVALFFAGGLRRAAEQSEGGPVDRTSSPTA